MARRDRPKWLPGGKEPLHFLPLLPSRVSELLFREEASPCLMTDSPLMSLDRCGRGPLPSARWPIISPAAFLGPNWLRYSWGESLLHALHEISPPASFTSPVLGRRNSAFTGEEEDPRPFHLRYYGNSAKHLEHSISFAFTLSLALTKQDPDFIYCCCCR